MPFEILKEQVGVVLVVTIEGDFVLGPKLRHVSAQIKDLENVRGILVDLRQCNRMDSAGMGELIMWYGIAAKSQQKLLLIGAKESIRTAMRLARVDGILLFAQDRESALRELGA